MENLTLKDKRERGTLVDDIKLFSPLVLLAKFPYKFLSPNDIEPVADAFFNAGKFWQREWEIFYVRSMDSTNVKPLTLVSHEQFMQLLQEIDVSFPHLQLLRSGHMQKNHENGLLISFPAHPRCTPRYLGVIKSREAHDILADKAPPKGFMALGETEASPVNEEDKKRFNELIDDAVYAVTNKKKESRAERHRKKAETQRRYDIIFKSVQRNLGLRKVFEASQTVAMSNEEALQVAESNEELPVLPAIDIKKPAPYSFVEDAVFISLDIEAWEHDQHVITELGFAILDTRELAEMPVGECGKNWFKVIEAQHLLISEYEHHVNNKYIQGNPRGFRFGETETVSINDAPIIFSETIDRYVKDKRQVFLLGHSIDGDLTYLDRMGFNPIAEKMVADKLDTQFLFRALSEDPANASVSLGNLLSLLDIEEKGGLHNAGNDAVYTMQALIAMLVLEATKRNGGQ